MSRNNIRKQINYCKKEITRNNKEYKDKIIRAKKKIKNTFNIEINELKSRVRALNKNFNKTANQDKDTKEKKR